MADENVFSSGGIWSETKALDKLELYWEGHEFALQNAIEIHPVVFETSYVKPQMWTSVQSQQVIVGKIHPPGTMHVRIVCKSIQ